MLASAWRPTGLQRTPCRRSWCLLWWLLQSSRRGAQERALRSKRLRPHPACRRQTRPGKTSPGKSISAAVARCTWSAGEREARSSFSRRACAVAPISGVSSPKLAKRFPASRPSPECAHTIVPEPRSAPTSSAAAMPCPCLGPRGCRRQTFTRCCRRRRSRRLTSRWSLDWRVDHQAIRQQLSEGGRRARARGCHSEGVQTAMTPERWKVYDRLLLVDPPRNSPTTRTSRPSTSM